MPTPNPTCPKCGSENVSEIIYGEVGSDYQKYFPKKVIPGGCCITEASPRWHCDACQHEWGRLPAPPSSRQGGTKVGKLVLSMTSFSLLARVKIFTQS